MKLRGLLYADKIAKKQQIRFGGMNHSYGAGDGEMWDMQNMTSDLAPLLSVRPERTLVAKLEKPGGIFSNRELVWVADGRFYYGGVDKGAVTEGEKTFAALGEYIVVFPDKVYYNRATDAFGSLESKWTGPELIFENGKLYEEDAAANCIYAPGVDWGAFFRVGDAVHISGCTQVPGNNTTPVIRAIEEDRLYFNEYIFTLPEEKSYTEQGELSVCRQIPDLRFLCENEGRLWGCTDSTLMASKWQDPFNWEVYDGLDTDSWSITPQSVGDFTGIAGYKGYVVAMKEEYIGKVYGSTAAAYQLMGSSTLGLQEGSGKSFAIAGETLFYLNRNGITAYGGGVPQPIGEAFGLEKYCNAVAGSDGLKYYVSMTDAEGVASLFVYDTQRGLWHKEDTGDVMGFCRHNGVVYMLRRDGELWAFSRDVEGQREQDIPWFVETADFTEEDPNKKGLAKLQIRMELDPGASAQVLIQYDSDGQWHRAGPALGEQVKRSYYLPVQPRRCDHYRIRIEGTGQCRIHSLVREVYSGSEGRSTKGRN